MDLKHNVLELFSGTHSVGRTIKNKYPNKYHIVSLDRDLPDKEKISNYHIMEDIMTWNYKQFSPNHFKIIWASPVCTWWSNLRNCWIGRKLKGMDRNLTREDLQNDIDTIGKPMVDKVREIIDYFSPEYYFIENPQTGKMKTYITDLPYYDVDYCKYSDWGYQKKTRIWTNLKDFEPKICKKDCENIVIVKLKKNIQRIVV